MTTSANVTTTKLGHSTVEVVVTHPLGTMHIFTTGEMTAAYHVAQFLDTIDPQDNGSDEEVVQS